MAGVLRDAATASVTLATHVSKVAGATGSGGTDEFDAAGATIEISRSIRPLGATDWTVAGERRHAASQHAKRTRIRREAERIKWNVAAANGTGAGSLVELEETTSEGEEITRELEETNRELKETNSELGENNDEIGETTRELGVD